MSDPSNDQFAELVRELARLQEENPERFKAVEKAMDDYLDMMLGILRSGIEKLRKAGEDDLADEVTLMLHDYEIVRADAEVLRSTLVDAYTSMPGLLDNTVRRRTDDQGESI